MTPHPWARAVERRQPGVGGETARHAPGFQQVRQFGSLG